MKRILISLICSIFHIYACIAQNFDIQQIGSVEIKATNIYAQTHPRNAEINKQGERILCGLLIVKSTVPDLIFPDAIGDVSYENSKYYVYLKPSKKTKSIKVESGNKNIKIKIEGGIESKVVYETTIIKKNEYGYLSIQTIPSNTKIYIDNVFIGNTPIKNYKLLSGEYRIRTELEGYVENNEIIEIIPNKYYNINFYLLSTPDYKNIYKQFH